MTHRHGLPRKTLAAILAGLIVFCDGALAQQPPSPIDRAVEIRRLERARASALAKAAARAEAAARAANAAASNANRAAEAARAATRAFRNHKTSRAGTRALPSSGAAAPGRHIARLRRLAPGAWLDLGRPGADPKWGRARGRAWTANMAYARSLDGAFLFGEGVHGWYDRKTGRYMDGLWLYDVMGHRWRNFWPGTDVRNPPDLIVNRDGFMALADGAPVPIATMVHGYQMTTWDSRRRRFMAMPNPAGHYARTLPTVAAFIAANRTRFNRFRASPWMFDIGARRWRRSAIATPGRSPPSGHGDTLIYLASRDEVFFRHLREIWFYRPAQNSWTRRNPSGPSLPFGIDATACHDPKRGRIYLGGGSYPVAKGPNALWIYDIAGDRFIDPRPRGDPGGNSYATNYAMLQCDLAHDVVLLVRHKGKTRGVYAYHPDDNAWETVSRGLPAMWPENSSSGGSSGFYHPGLGIHFFHVAGDSQDNGRILAYRYGR